MSFYFLQSKHKEKITNYFVTTDLWCTENGAPNEIKIELLSVKYTLTSRIVCYEYCREKLKIL